MITNTLRNLMKGKTTKQDIRSTKDEWIESALDESF